MGSGMARNVIKAGHTLVAYNRTLSRTEELRSQGATVAKSAGEAAGGADVVITMLADDHAEEDVVFGSGNVLESLVAGQIHACMSTISVALSRRLSEAHEKRSQGYVAAPVFGRPEAAAAAKLFVVAGGRSELIEKCQPIFDAIGQKTFVVGEQPAAANVVKLAGNFLISAVIESLAEALALARKSKLDPNQVLEIFTGTLFPAPVYRSYGGMIAADKFEPVGFKMPLGMKDNRLVLEAAEEAAVPMPIASVIRDHFVAAIAQGLGEADWSAIAKVSYRNAGLS
jgi:3-hydroxyisobutyrate dehydrogenase-like beta-hydroxyacid dehydrogenase